MIRLLCAAAALGMVTWGCGGDVCGPTEGEVAEVTDGDTITLASGEKVRYLMVDTPEISGGAECYGAQARDFNRSLVEGRRVQLRYDVECEDRFGRLLAYVTVDGRSVNELLVERGYACVLHIPPNGNDVVGDYEALEDAARSAGRGLWGFCSTTPC